MLTIFVSHQRNDEGEEDRSDVTQSNTLPIAVGYSEYGPSLVELGESVSIE